MTDNTWTQRAGMTSDTETDNVETYAEQAEASKVAAAASETAAAGSASSASTSAATATTKAAESASSATQSASSATASAASATQSASSATASANSATTAGAAQTAAETAKTGAETAQTAAETAQTAAETAETNAATSEAAALASKNAAATSATNSSTSATNSANSATASETSRVASVAAQAAAETAETNAETAETNAAASASAASTSASNASTSETNAATSASTATTQAGIATTKAGEAAASATASANSATASEAAKDAALAALDSFDDRYLGAKASDPTLDNDGNALVSGALYFNTTDDVMKVYEGSQWVAAYASLSGALLVNNNLSDVADAAGARTNLGLGTAATTASTDYATAAQGALAASATQPGDLATVATSGAYSDLSGTPTLGTAAATAATAYATAAQGALADSATQPGDLATVATSGAYGDLSGTPTLGTAATTASTDYATAAQGALADSAIQPNDTPTFAGIDVTGAVTADGLTVDGDGSVAGTIGVTLDSGTIQTGKDSASSRSHLVMNNPNGVVAKWDTNGTDLLHYVTDEYKLYTAGNKAFEIDGNGDISFYEDTGTTPKFFWDASAESLGIGTSSPQGKLEVSGDVYINGGSKSADASLVIQAGAAGTDGVTLDTSYYGGGYGPLKIKTGGTERMRLDASGNLLVGKTSTSAAVAGVKIGGNFIEATTSGGAGLALRRLSNDGDMAVFQNSSGSTVGSIGVEGGKLYIDSSGGVEGKLKNQGSVSYLWHSNYFTSVNDNATDLGMSDLRFKDGYFGGTVNAANFNTTSDATLKTNVETLSGSLDAVKSLRGVSFDWLENGGSEIGVIAQEVEAVLPNVVSTNDEGIKSVKYGNMVAVLIEAIKEQQLRIEALEAKLGE